MHLIKLDENNTVVGTNNVKDPAQFPHYLRLDDSYVLTASPISIGQVFDPEMGTFGPVPRRRWITKLAFDSRFTIPEAVALKAMQSLPARGVDELDADYIGRTQVPAQLQVLQSRLNMASYIDLTRADTRDGVLSLEAMGLLATGRALEILDGPIADHEYHQDA